MNRKKLRNSSAILESTFEDFGFITKMFKGNPKHVLHSLLAVVIIFGFSFGEAVAQEHEVSGVVTDSQTGETLPGVNILVVGSDFGTTTDIDGEFSLRLPSPNESLRFTFIGYQQIIVPVEGQSTLNVSMTLGIISGDELIVTGYSSQRRADITGAVASVNMESIDRQTSASVLQRLDGRVAGVTVDAGGSPGSRSTVRIRGISSFQNNEPLYIVDGTPVQDSFMNFLSPNDIESIQVLKDASAASIYGSRANNGVIIIETKKGREGAPQVAVDIRSGIATPCG